MGSTPPPPWVTNEAYWRKQHRRMVARAYDFLHGRMALLEVARELNSYRFQLRLEKDPDLLTFTAIDSEADHLPIGSARQYWADDALKLKDQERQDLESFYSEAARQSAQRIVQRYESVGRSLENESDAD